MMTKPRKTESIEKIMRTYVDIQLSVVNVSRISVNCISKSRMMVVFFENAIRMSFFGFFFARG